ncbi:MAG TPA: SDR family NAD(P)-dependent oxidoreductase, partial [Paenisporosarcina sp.]|nr:SDR family NAD(P)-dependent oxidoreductase [Paenisporosarcina sp.]
MTTEQESGNPFFIAGGTSGSGAKLSQLLVENGYSVIAGGRSDEHFDELASRITIGSLSRLKFFKADISDNNQLDKAFEDLDLQLAQPVNYIALAAEGFKKSVLMKMGMQFIRLNRELTKTGGITSESAEKATQNMKDNVATDEVLAETYKTNRD